MELTLNQKDALSELINIGYGRAAGALSELTGYRITLEAPQVAMYDIGEVGTILSTLISGDVASVNQVFSGPVAGNALLLLDERSALVLSELLTDERTASHRFDANAREVITEVGNILLNACLGVFGNLLQIQVSFAVPRMQVEAVDGVLRSITIASEELQYALMIHTRFHLRASNVTGYFVIILGLTSLDRLLTEVNRWEERQQQ
ncbi:chemotaxis protein CheC [Opitutus sp. ER46]|uniref:chemotaxis protein CheC n=1 Tax=Opitutus sp. ER46 TaxID=2161864 RepID=UPI000D3122F9|nr:chemotaxis protein CheC [Opitutus sp. ER46]PTX91185.1 chemotaxis protein CheC [Opitutus sp. ER46]